MMMNQNGVSEPLSLLGLQAGVWVRGNSQEYGGLTDSFIIESPSRYDLHKPGTVTI